MEGGRRVEIENREREAKGDTERGGERGKMEKGERRKENMRGIDGEDESWE